jgi:hypothetical protein
VTTAEEYRRHADAHREDDKAFWLKMARDWEKLAQLADARRKQG